MSLSKMFLIALLASASAVASAAAVTLSSDKVSTVIQPNRYGCTSGARKLVYTTTSLSGVPTFAYSDGVSNKLFTASGSEIQTVNSDLGTVVNVRVSSIPDVSNTEVNLILPQVNLLQATQTVTFSTELVESVWKTTIAGPSGVNGVVNANAFMPADCTASFVTF